MLFSKSTNRRKEWPCHSCLEMQVLGFVTGNVVLVVLCCWSGLCKCRCAFLWNQTPRHNCSRWVSSPLSPGFINIYKKISSTFHVISPGSGLALRSGLVALAGRALIRTAEGQSLYQPALMLFHHLNTFFIFCKGWELPVTKELVLPSLAY